MIVNDDFLHEIYNNAEEMYGILQLLNQYCLQNDTYEELYNIKPITRLLSHSSDKLLSDLGELLNTKE